MRIYGGRGAPIWLSERTGGGLVCQAGHSKLLLSQGELQEFCDGIFAMTGVRADPDKVRQTA